METRSSICSRRLYVAGWGVVVWVVGARSSVYGWRVVFSGVEGSTRSSIVGWRLRIDSRVALFWLLGGWRGGGGGAY